MLKKILIANRGEIAVRIITTARRLGRRHGRRVLGGRPRRALHAAWPTRWSRSARGPRPRAICAATGSSPRRARRPAPRRSTRATASSPRTPTSPMPPARPASSSSARRPTPCAAWAARPRPRRSRPRPACRWCRATRATSRAPRRWSREAKRIGFPVMIKAVAGGGGRGMRLVEREGEFAAALESAQREAQAAFGDARVLHREGDRSAAPHRGAGVRRRARQRRAPVRARLLAAAAQPEGDRGGARARHVGRSCARKITAAAVACAKAVGYEGAGTVEFLVEGGALAADGALVLHRDEHAPAGRASGDGGDHGARSRGVAAAGGGGREAAAVAERRSPCRATPSRRGSTPRTRPRAFCRRPGASSRSSRRARRAARRRGRAERAR